MKNFCAELISSNYSLLRQFFPGQCYKNRCNKHNDYEAMMVPGMTLQSHSDHYTLRFQSDRNLVLYYGRKPLWHTNTANGVNIDRLLLQRDGNLVLYRKDRSAAWSAHTSSAKVLNLQNDGNLVLYTTSGKAVWSTKTLGKCAIGLFFLQLFLKILLCCINNWNSKEYITERIY